MLNCIIMRHSKIIMAPINVKLLEVYGGILSGSSSVLIEIFKAEDSDIRYYSYTESGEKHENTLVYMYPYVNPIIYQMVDFIKKCGETRILDNGDVVGPHLTRKRNHNDTGYILYHINPDEEPSIASVDIVSESEPIPDQDWYAKLVSL